MSIIPTGSVKKYSEAEAKDLMGAIGWLAKMPEDFRNLILRSCRLVSYLPDEPIYTIGQPPGGLYGLVTGAVAIQIAPQERGPYFAHVMGPGNWYGLGHVLGGQARQLGLNARRASQLLLLPLSEINKVVTETPSAWRYFTALAVMNSQLAMSAVDDLLIRDPARRCMAGLLRMAGVRHSSAGVVVQSVVDVTQDELAFVSNLSRNSTGSVLRAMAKKGFLELNYKQVHIIDADAIRAFVTEPEL